LAIPISKYRAQLIGILCTLSAGFVLCHGKAQGAAVEVCPDLTMKSETSISFDETEKRLLCGDVDSDAWRDIPLNQKESFLRSFLSVRAYHQPEFSIKEKVLTVVVGPQTKIKSIVSLPEKEFLKDNYQRNFVSRPLTPANLDEIEKWVTRKLLEQGSPCPEVRLVADALTGLVTVTMGGGATAQISQIKTLVKGDQALLEEAAYRRFDAFTIGDPYSQIKLELTERRIVANGLAGNSYFVYPCPASDELALTHNNSLSPPRNVTFGFGFDSENLFVVKGSFKQHRLDAKGSRFETNIYASLRSQEWRTRYVWYRKASHRSNLAPKISVIRKDEENFESLETTLFLGPGGQYDISHVSLTYDLGPEFEWTKTLRGVGADFSRSLAFGVKLSLETNDFEYFAAQPRQGAQINLNLRSADKAYYSTYTAQKVDLNFHSLFNALNLDPPAFVLGLRGTFGKTITPGVATADETLPASMFHYLGGYRDVRGFRRQELPLDQKRALSSVSFGIEGRYVNAIQQGVQPFIFYDAGKLSQRGNAMDPPLYWSPGVGCRLDFGFGAIRLQLAKGFIEDGENQKSVDNHQHYQFHFSYGEEF
jgi:outer membrane translocation and assembly module TamA